MHVTVLSRHTVLKYVCMYVCLCTPRSLKLVEVLSLFSVPPSPCILQGRVLCLLEQCSEVVQELTELLSTVPPAGEENRSLLLPRECPKLMSRERGDGICEGAVEELSVSVQLVCHTRLSAISYTCSLLAAVPSP